MLEPVDISAALAAITPCRGRTMNTSEAELDQAFAELAPFDSGAVFTGTFSGSSAWECHTAGDELVHVLDGATTLIVVLDDGPVELAMTRGMVTVVPRGRWHRFEAPGGVTVLTATPHPTEHSTDPPPLPSA